MLQSLGRFDQGVVELVRAVTVVERAPGVVEQLLEEQDAARRDGTLEVGQPVGEREKALGFCANRKPVERLGAWKQAGVGVVDEPAQLVRTVQSPLRDHELGGAPREPQGSHRRAKELAVRHASCGAQLSPLTERLHDLRQDASSLGTAA